MRLESVYFGGKTFRRMASVLEYTAAKHCPDWDVNIRRVDVKRFTKSAYAKHTHLVNTQKMYEWDQVVRRAPDGAEILLIDADTFITQSLDGVWQKEFDLAYTTKPGERFPLNSGVVFVRVTPELRRFFRAWWKKNLNLLRRPREHHRWRKRYGGINQASFGAMLNKGTGKLNIIELSCREWNCEETNWRKFDQKTRIVHVKSGLRRAIFGAEEPKKLGIPELASLWRRLERRSKKQMAENAPDIVIPVRPGDDNEELRYALRSFEKNLRHRQIVIVGYKPSWLRNVLYIPVPQTGTKYRNSTRNLEAACEHPAVSEDFLLCNDDFFVLKRTDRMPVFHWGPVKDAERYYASRASGAYLQGLRATKKRLAELGYNDPLSYELHLPMPMNKQKFLEVLDLGRKIPALHKRTLYGNVAGLGGEEVTDPKITTTGNRFPRKARFLSTMDSSWHGPVGQYIKGLFPESSRYEGRSKATVHRRKAVSNGRAAVVRRQIPRKAPARMTTPRYTYHRGKLIRA